MGETPCREGKAYTLGYALFSCAVGGIVAAREGGEGREREKEGCMVCTAAAAIPKLPGSARTAKAVRQLAAFA